MTARIAKPPALDLATHDALTRWIAAVAAAKTLERAITPTMSAVAREQATLRWRRAQNEAQRERTTFALIVDEAAEALS